MKPKFFAKTFLLILFLSLTFYTNAFADNVCTDTLSVKASVVYPVKISFTPFMDVNKNIEMVVYAADTSTVISRFTKQVKSATDTTIYIGEGLFYLVSLTPWPFELKPVGISGTNVASTGSYYLNNLLTAPFRISPHKVLCEGKYILEANVKYSGTGTLRYKWTPGEGLSNDTIQRPVTDIISSNTYTVSVSSSNGCSASASVFVDVMSLTVNAGNDTSAVLGSSISLNKIKTNYNGSDKLRYKWTPNEGLNNDTLEQPTLTVQKNIKYTVTVTTPTGCTGQDEINVNVAPLSKPEIGIVGVSSNGKNRLAWNKPVSDIIDSYAVYKETSVTNIYDKIGTVPYDSLSIFEDNASDPKVKSNKYKLSVIDKIGLESELSTPHKTIHLTINRGQNNTWNLIWEPYEGFVAATYNIYRGTSVNSVNFLDAVSASSTQYADFEAPAGEVFYQIEVISPQIVSPTKVKSNQEENNSILYSYNSSRSNIASNLQNGLIDLENTNTLRVYPNPVKNILFIDAENVSAVGLLNVTGQTFNYSLLPNNSIDISDLPDGVYFVNVFDGEISRFARIIKL